MVVAPKISSLNYFPLPQVLFKCRMKIWHLSQKNMCEQHLNLAFGIGKSSRFEGGGRGRVITVYTAVQRHLRFFPSHTKKK